MSMVYFSVTNILDNVLIIGSEKGYVYPFEVTMDPRDKKKVHFLINELLVYIRGYERRHEERSFKDRLGQIFAKVIYGCCAGGQSDSNHSARGFEDYLDIHKESAFFLSK